MSTVLQKRANSLRKPQKKSHAGRSSDGSDGRGHTGHFLRNRAQEELARHRRDGRALPTLGWSNGEYEIY